MNSAELWTRIELELARYDLLQHPFYQAWSKGELTPEQLAFYGRQYGEHVSAFPAYLTRLHSRQPDGRVRRAILANAAEEEIRGRSHSDLWRQFSEGMGNRSEKTGQPKPQEPGTGSASNRPLDEVQRLVATFREIAEQATLAEALGAFYAYESQVPRVAKEKLAGLKSHYQADERTGEYFALHITADVHHAAVWRKLIDESVEERPECADEVLSGVSRAAKALWTALDGIEAARTASFLN